MATARGEYAGKRSQTRRRLLRAGLTVVAERGVGALSIARVAAEAGVVPGTVYNYFDGRDDLVVALVDLVVEAIELQADAVRAAGDDVAVRLAAMAAQLLSTAERDPLAVRAFIALVAEVPEVEARVRDLVAGIVDAGRTAGRFAVEAGPVAVDAVLAVAVQAARARLAGRTTAEADAATIRLILRLVGLVPADVDLALAALRA